MDTPVQMVANTTPHIGDGGFVVGDYDEHAVGSSYVKFIEDVNPFEMFYILEAAIRSEENMADIEICVPFENSYEVRVAVPDEVPFTVSSPYDHIKWQAENPAEWLMLRSHPVRLAELGEGKGAFCINRANAMFPASKVFVTDVDGEPYITMQNTFHLTGGVSCENIEARVQAHRKASLQLRSYCNQVVGTVSNAH